jgi:hypothetical protein
MNNNFKPIEYDIIYLSYDEPNAEKNYADLCKKVPWAKRVHGVEGSDAAHKACAMLSETERFITIDGDNIIDEAFLSQDFNLNNHEDVYWNRSINIDNCVISWSAKNVINGLVYGNGGIKCWPKNYVMNMKTHENADPDNIAAQVDFCWDLEYIQINKCFSTIMNNGSAQQAWRAGFREGVKMCLERGSKPSIEDFQNNHWRNLHRLYIWTMIGSDIENGIWAIYGARHGLVKTMLSDWDYVNVRNFDWLNSFWSKNIKDLNPLAESINLGKKIVNQLELPISEIPLNSEQSRFFKTVYQNPNRFDIRNWSQND